MKTRITGTVAVALLCVVGAVGCSRGSDDTQSRSAASEAKLIKVECYWEMRSGDEPVEWEREIPEGDTAAYEQAEKDCTATRSGAMIRVVS